MNNYYGANYQIGDNLYRIGIPATKHACGGHWSWYRFVGKQGVPGEPEWDWEEVGCICCTLPRHRDNELRSGP